MSINPPITITTTDRFDAKIRKLGKRYRSIRLDILPLIEQLESGKLPGDQIPGIEYTLFKVRVRNNNIQKGKSGGYRVVYYLKTEERIMLVTIYSKSDESDVTIAELRGILTNAEKKLSESDDIPE